MLEIDANCTVHKTVTLPEWEVFICDLLFKVSQKTKSQSDFKFIRRQWGGGRSVFSDFDYIRSRGSAQAHQ